METVSTRLEELRWGRLIPMHGVIKCIDGQMVDVVERISLKLVWVSTQEPERRPFSLGK